MVNTVSTEQRVKNQKTKFKFKGDRFTAEDWHYNNLSRYNCAEAQQKLADKIIAKSDNVCQSTTETVKANRNETNHCLSERIKEIEYCKEELTRNRNELILELEALLTYKNRLVDSLSFLRQSAHDICQKCLRARENRIGIDLVNDDVERELRKECSRIVCADRLMTETLEQTDEQLRHLKSTLFNVDHDLQEKESNLRIDRYNLTLKETSLNLSLYHGSNFLDASSITLEEWEMQTKRLIDSSAKEIQVAKKIRFRVDFVLNQIFKDLLNQKNVTDEAFRVRIEQFKEAKEKLELQHSEIMRQANEMSKNITRLEKVIAEKEGFIALAHTRLGNRCQRPGLELTRDKVEISLTKEVSELREVVAQLQQTLFEAQASLRFLLKMQIQLEEDINIKANSIKIDEVDCVTMRQSIDYRVF